MQRILAKRQPLARSVRLSPSGVRAIWERHGLATTYQRLMLRKREIGEGTLAVVEKGEVLGKLRFEPDRDFEERTLPAVRAPHEGTFCLQRLAALAAIS